MLIRVLTPCFSATSAGLAIALLLSASPSPLKAETVSTDDVVSPLVTLPIAAPNPVLGSDDRTHLAYELVLMSMASGTVAIEKVETLEAESGSVLNILEGDALTQMLRLNGGAKGNVLPAGGSGILFMDVTLPGDATIPKAVNHRIEISAEKATAPKTDGDRDPAPEPAEDIVFTSDALPVGEAAVAVAPPLKGKGWVVGGGCCTPYSYHRGATLPINGAIRVAERFAIDFVQLNDQDALADGAPDKLESYAYFGDAIHAVAAGTVVAVEDDLPEQIPGKLPDDATIQMAGGNYAVIDIGDGRFTFYAHMQPGSLKVKAGDKVKTGDVIGLLGNSGNTDSPHLHFHVMDGPSPLLANGLPYVFTSFTGAGRITDEDPLFKGGKVNIDPKALSGPHKNQLPLNLEVIDFP